MIFFFFFFFFFYAKVGSHLLFFFCFLGLQLWHMEVPRPGGELELQPLAYTTAIAIRGSEPTPQLTATPGPQLTERD